MSRIKRHPLIPVSLISLGLAMAASAALAATNFEEADLDEDGNLSKVEADEVFPEINILDRNEDGMISTFEAQRAIPNIEFPNASQDRTVTAEEYEVIVVGVDKQLELEEGTQSEPLQSDR